MALGILSDDPAIIFVGTKPNKWKQFAESRNGTVERTMAFGPTLGNKPTYVGQPCQKIPQPIPCDEMNLTDIARENSG